MSRHSPRTRTKRLPIEDVSQSSENQRKGRCGRVAEGVCIRLFKEEEFEKRPAYTQPEIQRANLAEVILRMKAFRLGEIETFPFINPPQSAAVRAGYTLLHELGALNDTNELTGLPGSPMCGTRRPPEENAPNASGFPGRIRTVQKFTSPSFASTSFTTS